MRNVCLIFLFGVLLGCGCSSSVDLERRPIAMCASTGEILVEGALQTKADDVRANPYTGMPSYSNKLEVGLWFSYSLGEYSHDPQPPQYLPCATTAIYENSARMDIKSGDNILLYPIAADINYDQVGEKVYCVGFYPSTGWTQLTGENISFSSHDINGSEDLMFADQMVGSYTENFEPQEFNHLLTWLKIIMNSTSIEAASVWGEVESLTVISPSRNVKLTFSKELDASDKPMSSAIIYDGNEIEFPLALPADRGLNITARTFGQVFCAPPKAVDGKFGYTIRVKTKNLPEKEVFVALKMEDNTTNIHNSDYTVGKLFVINLRFNDIAVVEGVCTLKQWDDQSSDIYFE